MRTTAATPVTDGYGLALSTNAEAAAHFRQAVVELLGKAPAARRSFVRAVQAVTVRPSADGSTRRNGRWNRA